MRRLGIGLGLVVIGLVGGVVFLWPAQRTGSEPITYGRDRCDHCRMHISQPGFGGELRDRDGVLTKYDDIGCLLHAMLRQHHEVPEVWVEDHGGGGFVPLLSAKLVQADGIETPMGSGLVAFAGEAGARALAQSRGGRVLVLEDVLRDPARLLPARMSGTHADGNEGSHP
jgi:copper chaperone NosL